MRLLTALPLLTFIVCAEPVFAATARPVAKFQDWSAFVYESDGQKLCFVASEPKATEPKGVNRGQILFYVSNWAAINVRNEVSIKIGYPLKENSQPQVIVGDKTITMFSFKDKAFIADASVEKQLVAAMKAGSAMVVKGVSARGTNTLDRYSLAGITAALNRMAKDCP